MAPTWSKADQEGKEFCRQQIHPLTPHAFISPSLKFFEIIPFIAQFPVPEA
jgi:hypothetical protein